MSRSLPTCGAVARPYDHDAELDGIRLLARRLLWQAAEVMFTMRYPTFTSLMLAGALACGAAACQRDARRTEPTADERARQAPSATDATRDAGRDAGTAAREAGRDASGAVGTAGKSVAGAMETFDVKQALMRDDGVDASNINVDTDGNRKVVVLKGTVSTLAQKNRAEQIASREAKGYRIDNQLMVKSR